MPFTHRTGSPVALLSGADSAFRGPGLGCTGSEPPAPPAVLSGLMARGHHHQGGQSETELQSRAQSEFKTPPLSCSRLPAWDLSSVLS